jgi:hypothetical protein
LSNPRRSCKTGSQRTSLPSKLRDFEDAVQHFSAVQAGAGCLISRNPDDFPRTSECPVLTPAEFLAAHAFE